jgi:hypothetical protein
MPHVGSRDSHIATAPPPPPNATKFESRWWRRGLDCGQYSQGITRIVRDRIRDIQWCNWKEFPNKLASDRLDVWLTHSDYIRLIIVRLSFEQCFDIIVTLCHVTFQVPLFVRIRHLAKFAKFGWHWHHPLLQLATKIKKKTYSLQHQKQRLSSRWLQSGWADEQSMADTIAIIKSNCQLLLQPVFFFIPIFNQPRYTPEYPTKYYTFNLTATVNLTEPDY